MERSGIINQNDSSNFAATATWQLDGVSDEAIAWAESEAARCGLSLAEWVAEAIEGALIASQSGNGPDKGAL
jgi:hypothetical protein